MQDRKRQDMQDKNYQIHSRILFIMPLAILKILFFFITLRILRGEVQGNLTEEDADITLHFPIEA